MSRFSVAPIPIFSSPKTEETSLALSLNFCPSDDIAFRRESAICCLLNDPLCSFQFRGPRIFPQATLHSRLGHK
ncbi:hypothetical protein SLE2022_169120 [Rubroshorea leprosula]